MIGQALHIAGMVVWALLAIAILIAIHEFGHFWVARKLGFWVERFAIGFGKPLLRWRGKDGVEYQIGRWPIGGYVKMLGEHDQEVPAEKLSQAFNRRPVWQRIAVLLAGPGFNFILAILAFWLVFMAGVPGIRAVLGAPTANSLAADAGIRAGDEIVAVAGRAVDNINDAQIGMLEAVVASGDIPLRLRAQNGQEREISIPVGDNVRHFTKPGALYPELGMTYWMPPLDPVIGAITPNSAAERAGLQVGDRIMAITVIDRQSTHSWQDFVDIIRKLPNQPIIVSLIRQGSSIDLNAVVGVREGSNEGLLGVAPEESPAFAAALDELRVIERYPVLPAFVKALSSTWDYSLLTLRMLWHMLIGRVSTENLSGPVTIVQYAGESAALGWHTFVHFIAILSLSLGVLNLIPIPILDGGQIVYQLIEGVRGIPLSMRIQTIGYQVGVALLLMLFVVAFYNDITRLPIW